MKKYYKLYSPRLGLLFIVLSLLAVTDKAYAQPAQEYHFVYVDMSKTKELNKLQTQLENLNKQIKDQKYVYFLSNRNEAVVAVNQTSFNKLLASISNLTTTVPNLDAEIEHINRVMSENDFLQLEITPTSSQLKQNYKKVTFHFFLNPVTFNTLNMKKYLIETLLAVNYAHTDKQSIEVILYMDGIALKTIQETNPAAFSSDDFKLIKY